ncbi:MAG: hypothetical protein AAF192_07425, partial [Pseudomonadota bacterium]
MQDGTNRRRAAAAAALTALLAAAGCSDTRDAVAEAAAGTEFRILEPSTPAEAEPEARLVDAQLRPVSRVASLELGRMHRARLLVARGEAPRTGWFQPELRPRRDGAPGPDGFLEFDFIAAPPELNGGGEPSVGSAAQRRIKAVRPIPERELRGA